MKNIIYILSVALLSSTAMAQVNTLNIVSQESANFIRAEYSQENTVIIKSCETLPGGEEACEVLGDKGGYTGTYIKIKAEELEKQKNKEAFITFGVVSVGFVVGGMLGIRMFVGKPTGGNYVKLSDVFFGVFGGAVGGSVVSGVLGVIYLEYFANAAELAVALSRVNLNIKGENLEITIEVDDMKSFKRDLMDALI